MKRLALTLLAISLAVPALRADDDSSGDKSLDRAEVSAIKKHLTAVQAALGLPPAGYVKQRDNFNLPTEYSKSEGGGYYPQSASADFTFGGDENKVKHESEKVGEDYQKKIAEAMAKGDYEAVAGISQEMQKKSGELQVKQLDVKKEPVEVSIQLNSFSTDTIDPDKVLFEKPGVIALKRDTNDDKKADVKIFFDPVTLKDTKKLSKVELREPKSGAKAKTGVVCVAVTMRGPAATVEAWAKRIDTKAVLAQTSPDASN